MSVRSLADAIAPPTKEVHTSIPNEVNHPEFVPVFSARIATLVHQGVEQARVHLNPVEMGPVSVQLALDGQQVRVDMTAELAVTRQVLEKSLPALAGALREAGFTLSGGGVFAAVSDVVPTPRQDCPADRPWTGQGTADNLYAGSGAPNGQGHGQGSDGRPSPAQTPHMPSQAAGADVGLTMEVEVGASGVVRPQSQTRLLDLFA